MNISVTSFDENAIFEQVKNVICQVLSISRENVLMESNVFKDFNADSLDKVSLIIALEDKFKHSISDDEIKGLTTVDSIVAFIAQKSGIITGKK